MKTKTFERDGEQITVKTGVDEDGDAAIIITHIRRSDGRELECTLTLTDDPAASDAVFDFINNDNVWDWPIVPAL